MPIARRLRLSIIASTVLFLAGGLLFWEGGLSVAPVLEAPAATPALETVTLTIDGMI